MSTIFIHGFQLELDPRLAWSARLQLLLSDVSTASLLGPPRLGGAIEITYDQAAGRLPGTQSLAPALTRSNDWLVDHKYGVAVNWSDPEHTLLRTEYACPEWLSWCLQLVLLRQHASFVHAAGLVQDGRAYLFAGNAGVGKTALAAAFIQHFGYQLLGDDVTVVGSDGTCYGYPRALVVHPEHRSFLPAAFTKRAGRHTPIHLSKWVRRAGRIAKPVLRHNPRLLEHARAHHPANARLLATDVFGPDCIAAPAPLAGIIWLERRRDIAEIRLCPEPGPFSARLFAGMLTEFDGWCVRASNLAMANGMLCAAAVYPAWLTTLAGAVADVPVCTLAIPAAMPFAEMPAQVHEQLHSSAILERCEVAR
jgi:hypothetical protein